MPALLVEHDRVGRRSRRVTVTVEIEVAADGRRDRVGDMCQPRCAITAGKLVWRGHAAGGIPGLDAHDPHAGAREGSGAHQAIVPGPDHDGIDALSHR
ncbi:MAG: hypothetical protein U5K76_16265 [Woeseiaceae bacterium]|nr:hypothetical protein [Woeseiaceae bacterium]